MKLPFDSIDIEGLDVVHCAHLPIGFTVLRQDLTETCQDNVAGEDSLTFITRWKLIYNSWPAPKDDLERIKSDIIRTAVLLLRVLIANDMEHLKDISIRVLNNYLDKGVSE